MGVANSNGLKTKRPAPRLDTQGECIVIYLRFVILHVPNHSRSAVSEDSTVKRKLTLTLEDEAATLACGTQFAHVLSAGLVIYLHGDLGAGKTTWVRAVLQGLGYAGRVKSPSYTLLERYEARGLHLRHFDLYRFRDAEEWETSGFRDEFDGQNICMVEWPQQAAGLLPTADLLLSFEILNKGRTLVLDALSASGEQCLNDFSA